MPIRAYADEHGIGILIFEEEEAVPSYDTPMDLRLNDVDSFLAFAHELLAASKEMGWFKKTAIQYSLIKD